MATEFVVRTRNRPGQLATITAALGEAGVNLRAVSGTTAGPQGWIGLVVGDKDAAKARRALKKAGLRGVKERKAIEVRLADRPGTLARASSRLAKGKVNIESAYVLAPGRGNVAVAFGVKNARAANKALGRR